MIDKFCKYLTNKIRKKMPEIDDERAEVILYGIQLIVGEIPKIFFMFGLGFILGLCWQTLLAFFLILPYKACSGGFHLKTHLGCFVCTNIIYCGNAILSTIYTFPNELVKIIVIAIIWMIAIILVSIYAPADTENLPILTKKERRIKKSLSYVFLSINMLGAIFIPNKIIVNLLVFGTVIQTISITRIAYILTKNKYGYEEYLKAQNITI
ncbi:MAG: accessory gene regulator B family protein [Clostridia bacterium]|nr:accessory gene regulator B family protein [Clostridia bacterium]